MAKRSKAELRKQMASLRAAVSLEQHERASRALAEQVMPLLHDAQIVLLYSALAHELSLVPLAEALQARGGATVVYPRVEGPRELTLCHVPKHKDLVPGTFKVYEPCASAEVIAPAAIDVALVPGVAFTAGGDRLGYGGGYYDSLLPKLRSDARTIGVGFEFQLVDELPVEPHDVLLDTVVVV